MATEIPQSVEFGRYRCTGYLGGGMAEVYRGYDPLMDREVAVKVLRQSECHNEKVRQRFLREAQLACRCHHDNIVVAYDAGEHDGRPYMVMELLPPGSSLPTVLAGHVLSQKRVIEIACDIADALAYVHSLGIVHRDVKPSNICIEGRTGRAKLIDFGIARTPDWEISAQGTVGGTLPFMAPELMKGDPKPNPLHDVYSFGAVLFELLAGQRLVKGTEVADICFSIINDPPDLDVLRARGVTPKAVDLVADCLKKEPAERPQSFDEIRARLSAILQTDNEKVSTVTLPESARLLGRWRIPLWAIVAGAVLVLVLIAAIVWPKGPPPFLRLPTGDMVLINGGPALLGPDRHRVVANAFYIDKLEVSNAAYADFCHATGRPLPEDAESPRLPVVNVPFPDAEAFAHWAGKRLPRAEEWEKAARGADGLRFPWGDLLDLSRVNLGGPNAAARRAEVDSYPQGASPYGVLNLLGNVWEWVDERERPDESTLKQLANQDWARKLKPPPRLDETYVQIRGGSYLANRPEDLAALVYGSALLPSRVRRPDVGFRCVKDLAKP